MSRIGRTPVEVPSGVEVAVSGRSVSVTGPRGVLNHELPPTVTVSVDDGVLTLERTEESRQSRALHGLSRALVNNMVVGVSEGYTKELQIVGVGYRAQARGSDAVELSLGFSHTITVDAPEGVSFETPEPTRILISGIDKQLVGQVAANIRALRKPEPYKGKGIRYANEHVQRKAGKAAK